MKDLDLTPELLTICIDITQKLMKYPSAKLFLNPVDSPEYIKRIKNPQDLTSILSRLKNNEYRKVNDWERDINYIWTNTETFNGKNSLYSIIANQMSKKFNELKQCIDILRVSGWMKQLHILREKMDRLLLSPPLSVDPIIPNSYNTKIDYPEFSNQELDQFINSSFFQKGFSSSDISHIMKILSLEPKAESIDHSKDELKVNVDLLSPKVLKLLNDFFQKKHEKENRDS